MAPPSKAQMTVTLGLELLIPHWDSNLVHYNSELDFSGPFSTQCLKERYLVLPIAHAVCTLYYYSSIFGLFLRVCHLPEVLINRIMGFPGRAVVKNPLARHKEMQIWALAWEDPLKKAMATHSSILAWEIPQTEKPDGLQSIGLQRVGHKWVTEQACK